jgi:hypothetical protein
MAGRKPAAVSGADVRRVKLAELVALRERVAADAAESGERELLPRVLDYWRGRYQRGLVSEKVARQLGIA